ncbi:MAG: hypothetical protein WCI77_07030 [Candidatus Omnitrophota bacterium]
MKKIPRLLKSLFFMFVCLGISGCVTVPTGFLKPNKDYLEKRQLQIRQYDTTDQEKIITSVAGVLQDLGFTLDASETQVGFIAASKKADATNLGQVFFVALLGGANAVGSCDKSQIIKASVITKPGLDGKKTVVRVTFQRVVWNMRGEISRVETLKEPVLYQNFYDSLSKAIFLEAQQI